MSIDYGLTLDYQLQAGWLEPFVHGLLQGTAVARRCKACNKITFPPIRVCDCHHDVGEWLNLSGKAHIVYRCDGADGSFALVQFEGADTKTVVRLEAMTDVDEVGYLHSAQTNGSTDNASAESDNRESFQSPPLPQLAIAPQRPGDSNE